MLSFRAFLIEETEAEQRQEYIHGSCWSYAVALGRLRHWPVFALHEPNDFPVHAVNKMSDGRFVDAMGVVTLPQLQRRYGLSKKAELIPYSESQVDAVYGLDEDELEMATAFINKFGDLL